MDSIIIIIIKPTNYSEMADMVSKHSKKVKLSLSRALNMQGQRYMPLFILYLGAT